MCLNSFLDKTILRRVLGMYTYTRGLQTSGCLVRNTHLVITLSILGSMCQSRYWSVNQLNYKLVGPT